MRLPKAYRFSDWGGDREGLRQRGADSADRKLPGVIYVGGRVNDVGRAELGPGWRVIDARSGRRTPCPVATVALAIDLDDRAGIHHQLVHRRHRHGVG